MVDRTNEAGFSFENPVIIPASGSIFGVKAEENWLETHYGFHTINWTLIKRNITHTQDDRWIDIIEIKLINDTMETVYFDISSCFHPFERFIAEEKDESGILLSDLLKK